MTPMKNLALGALFATCLTLSACAPSAQEWRDAPSAPASSSASAQNVNEDKASETSAGNDADAAANAQAANADEAHQSNTIHATANGETLEIELADNSSADAFAELLSSGPLTVKMEDYGGFEKVGPLGTSLPQNNEQITTQPGDVILYQGDKITIYYAENTWNFTRLGKVKDLSADEIKDLLGPGNTAVTFSLT